jgi:hypothetical protein
MENTMSNKTKLAITFIGFTVWMIIVSAGVYRFKSPSALEQMTLVYECSSELLKKNNIDVTNNYRVYIEKFGSSASVVFEAPIVAPYEPGKSIVCNTGERNLVTSIKVIN